MILSAVEKDKEFLASTAEDNFMIEEKFVRELNTKIDQKLAIQGIKLPEEFHSRRESNEDIEFKQLLGSLLQSKLEI